MGMGRKISRLFGRRPSSSQKEEVKNYSMENGALVLEGVITGFNGKHQIPVRSFTSHELVTATDNFSQLFTSTFPKVFDMYSGSFQQCPILVSMFSGCLSSERGYFRDEAIRDIVVTSQMSIHGNVLKLLGCCLEYQTPALVYEYPPGAQLLSRLLRDGSEDRSPPLTWRSRLKIANDIANVILYLHSAFTTPIIFRDLKSSRVMIDQNGVAKLFDFSESISLPPGESQVEDPVPGTWTHIDPECLHTGFVSEKTDVYLFGVLLLKLLTGKPTNSSIPDDDRFVVAFAHNHEDQLDEIVDVKILGEGGGGIVQQQQLQSFFSLALACTKDMKGDRPEMLDVARELRRIMRSSTSRN